MPIDKRKVQEINAGSMADIAFLLLIFFLVATTMNVDTGIARNLPPMPPEDQKVEDMKVKIRNLLPVLVNGRGDIFVGRAGEQEYVDIHLCKRAVARSCYSAGDGNFKCYSRFFLFRQPDAD